MLASPGHSPRHILPPPSPSPSIRSIDSREDHVRRASLVLSSTHERGMGRPPLPKKLKKTQIPVDEDRYVAAIEKIIERDFFPDIPKLQNRLEWLEAVRSGDPVVIREAQMNIIQRRKVKAREQGERDATPSTVADFATPSSMISGAVSPSLSLRSGQSPSPSQIFDGPLAASSSAESGPAIDTSLPLDEFLRRYTSEDNASFSQIIEKVNKQRKQKYEFLSEKELIDPNLRITQEGDRITDGFGTSGQPEATLETWKYRAKSLLMYDSAEREDAPLTQAEREELVEGLPKAITIRNTRFHGKMFDSKLREEDTVAILYTPVPGSTPVAWPFAERDAERARKRYDLEELRRTPQAFDEREARAAGGVKGAGGPGGYSFVATPSPAPGVDESPFMTWGEIEGTPLRLETEDTPVGIGGSGDGPHFKIPAPPTRDARAHTLSRDAARSLREKSKLHQIGSSPSPMRESPSPVMGSLSAAAQKFVSKAMAKTCGSVDARLRASYRASTTPGTPRMARNAVRSREGSLSGREGSLPLRSPSVRENSLPAVSPTTSPVGV